MTVLLVGLWQRHEVDGVDNLLGLNDVAFHLHSGTALRHGSLVFHHLPSEHLCVGIRFGDIET